MPAATSSSLPSQPVPPDLGAEKRCQEVLLSCYCREVASPEGHLSVGPLRWQSDLPMSLKAALQRSGGQVLQVSLAKTGTRILAVVSAPSATGNFRFLSPLCHKRPGQAWAPMDWETLAASVVKELAERNGTPPNTELLEQIRDSIEVTNLALSAVSERETAQDPFQAYIQSEQSLTFGHPFHPAPKSRQGFSREDLRRYSPEMRARFPLHWFAVDAAHIVQQSALDRSCAETVALRAPQVPPGYTAVPAHPWQAAHFLAHPLIGKALAKGTLLDLGPQGEDFFPTSSIRTLYQKGNPFFYKFSLNVRITNCVRKNAWYELEGALQVTHILRRVFPALRAPFPGLRVLEEPAFLSIDLRDADAQRNLEVTEGFGLILRETLEGKLPPGSVPLLAGSLFGDHVLGERRLRNLIESFAERAGVSRESAAEIWFHAYAAQLLPPVLHCFFAHGIIFEPHLQNVVIGLEGGLPRQLILRDFEGVKLVPEHHGPAQLGQASPRAREALWYSAEQGWNRIAYCLFVNNFCEAIGRLAGDSERLERRLWAIVRHHLQEYQSRFGHPASAPKINALLSGQAFPGKGNLTNRFFKRPDKEAAYHPVGNPLAMVGGNPAWN
jgi:siderophore synthetase component